MNNSSARRASIILGVFMAIVLAAGAIIPLISPNQTITQASEPTTAPTPTYPPVISDLSTISFDKVYLHPTGMYTIPEPTGWEVSQPTSNTGLAQVNMINSTQLSVIDAFVQDAEGTITAQDLNDRFTPESILETWSNFRNPIETNRSFNNDMLTVDFRVELPNGQTYVARQNVWTDGTWIYVVRVVVPENATELLRFLLDNLTGKIVPFKQFETTPFNWASYYDPVVSHIIRFPQEWAVTDSAPGRPTSISSENGVNLRVEARSGVTVADEAAARALVEAERPGANIISVVPVTRGEASGFSVAYTFTDVEGAAQSGLAVLLNGATALHMANLRFPDGDIDLNAIDTTPAEVSAEATPEVELPGLLAEAEAPTDTIYVNLAQVMETFQVLPLLDLSVSSLPPATPTAIPTIAAPTAEVTTEATVEEPTAEVTAEATAGS